MASALTRQIISDATAAVENYSNAANGYFGELKSLIESLTTNDYFGDGSTGYKFFFDNKITPALTTNLTDPTSSLMAGIKTMLNNIQTTLMDTVDPQIGNSNQSL